MIAVVTAAEAREGDRLAVEAGTESFELMRRAGTRAAHLLLERFPAIRRRGVQVFAGPGNNGGDGHVLATALIEAGCPVGLLAVPPGSHDARLAKAMLSKELPTVIENPCCVVDAVLGTGATGEIRENPRGLLDALRATTGRPVVALDLPSGLDATTGAAARATPAADVTISFGTWKRGQLLRRDLCGELWCVDIGLPEADSSPRAADRAFLEAAVPAIGARANKGDRGRLLVVGGAPGMAGATSYAALGALHSGIGMVRCAVNEASVNAAQVLVPQAVACPWTDASPVLAAAELTWAHAVVLGPGFGLAAARERAAAWLEAWRGPVVVDADALSAFAGAAATLAALLADRPAVVTPHAAEAARLLGTTPREVAGDPFGAVASLAALLRCSVLLKGVPTLVAQGSEVLVVPRGAPVLGTGGSGDLLAGIVGTLLAQGVGAPRAAAAGAWIHGRAGEIAQGGGGVRGVTLDDVVRALRPAWESPEPALEEHLLGVLPAPGRAA